MKCESCEQNQVRTGITANEGRLAENIRPDDAEDLVNDVPRAREVEEQPLLRHILHIQGVCVLVKLLTDVVHNGCSRKTQNDRRHAFQDSDAFLEIVRMM